METCTYTPRIIDAQIADALANVPAICIEGAKGVGKTITAKRFAKTVLELDNPATREALLNNLDSLATLPRPVLIDEWQQAPDTWNKIRRLVDAGAPKGSFILTGSVSKTDASLHSGAGRILALRMRPFALAERLARPASGGRVSLAALLDQQTPFSLALPGKTSVSFSFADYAKEITRSGFPGMRDAGAGYTGELVASYLQYAVTRDFAAQGVSVRRPASLMRWLKAYAAAVSTDAGYGEILDASTPGEADKPARGTTIAYRDALERLWLLDELPPWLDGGNYFSRLKQTPRHHLADPALVCSLLGIDTADLLAGRAQSPFDAKHGTFAGRLFESLLVQSVRAYADANRATVSYLRTQTGNREVDLIIQKKRRIVAFEVKLSPTVSDDDTHHLAWLKEQLGNNLADAAVLTAGNECYRRKKDGVAVIPAALLAP